MTRRTLPLDADLIDRLPPHAQSCLMWEGTPAQRAGSETERFEHKRAWVREVTATWGQPGRVLLCDDTLAGFAIYAPAHHFVGAGTLPTAPAASDALLLATAYVAPPLRRHGLGRLLLQGMAKDALHRHHNLVEAFADTRGTGGHCAVPVEFLHSFGFHMQRAHSTYPRLRLELRTALTWKTEVEHALERLWGAVRPVGGPVGQPAKRETLVSR